MKFTNWIRKLKIKEKSLSNSSMNLKILIYFLVFTVFSKNRWLWRSIVFKKSMILKFYAEMSAQDSLLCIARNSFETSTQQATSHCEGFLRWSGHLFFQKFLFQIGGCQPFCNGLCESAQQVHYAGSVLSKPGRQRFTSVANI